MDKLTAVLAGVGGLTAELSGDAVLSGELSVPEAVAVEEYAGPYVYSPGAEPQTVEISGMRATQNIIIEAVPQNYGLITWNGSTLTVS